MFGWVNLHSSDFASLAKGRRTVSWAVRFAIARLTSTIGLQAGAFVRRAKG